MLLRVTSYTRIRTIDPRACSLGTHRVRTTPFAGLRTFCRETEAGAQVEGLGTAKRAIRSAFQLGTSTNHYTAISTVRGQSTKPEEADKRRHGLQPGPTVISTRRRLKADVPSMDVQERHRMYVAKQGNLVLCGSVWRMMVGCTYKLLICPWPTRTSLCTLSKRLLPSRGRCARK